MPLLEPITALLQVLVELVRALAWPLLLLTIFLYFRKPLSSLLSEAREASIKAGPGGVEATISRAVKSATSLTAARAQKAGIHLDAAPERQLSEVDEAVGVINQAVVPNMDKLDGARLLWVDDHPGNNFYEREMLQALGIRIAISRTTADALQQVRLQPFDVIVSDMAREDEPRAGYNLLEALRAAGNEPPLIIYSGSATEQQRAETLRRRAFGQTNNPSELLQMVISAIIGGQRR